MIFRPAELESAYFIDLKKHEDERGFFARTWCEKEAAEHGLTTRMVQTNTSYNKTAGTLRGLHYQAAPHQEAKLIRCTQGAIYDVIADIRPDSPTYRQWIGVELTADNYRMLYVPEGFAHGFLTLTDDAEIIYQVSAYYAPQAERGARFDDPAFGIEWPGSVKSISEKDKNWDPFQ